MSGNQPQKSNSGNIVRTQALSYSGPIPLQVLEKKVIGTDSRNSLLGIISAFIISLAALVLAAYAIHLGQVGAGTFIGTTSFAALITAFIYGTQSRENRETKQRQVRIIL